MPAKDQPAVSRAYRERRAGETVVTKELLAAVRDSRVYSEQLPNGGIRLTIDMHRGADSHFRRVGRRASGTLHDLTTFAKW